MKNYPELLLAQNIQLISPYTTCKEKHDMLCLNCNQMFNANILGKIQNFVKYGKNGCPHCFKQKNKIIKDDKINNLLNDLAQNGYEVLGKFQGDFYSSPYAKLFVKKISCNHSFICNPWYVKQSDYNHCKICWQKMMPSENLFIKNGFTPTYINNVRCVEKDNMVVFVHDINKIQEQMTGTKKFMLNLNKLISSEKRVLHFYSDELENNNDLLFNKIGHIAHTQQLPKIYARQCMLRVISNIDKSKFLNEFHNQGNDAGQINYGAYYNDELVAVMTFCAPRVFMSNKPEVGTFELARFATNTNYHVVGIASKLLSHFQKNNQYKRIISFADKRYSVGNLYYKLGFTLEEENNPNYFYVINGERKYRWKYRKDSLREMFPDKYDASLTEYKNMLNMGYDRVWDCGSMRFVLLNVTDNK